MDPDRVRAYLQVACAGLGFDIGEVWWSSSEGASTALAAIEEKHDDLGSASTMSDDGKKMRFVQLYTSRSYETKRNQLVTPADEEENYVKQVNGDDSDEDAQEEAKQTSITAKKHVLSPLLVDAISKTAQVVWAHTKKQEGLTGRSDMRLQTAVGMPVAIDGSGNMCIVVMFSPNNISSTDDALEYLQSISRSATSTSIPSLLPAFDPKQGLVSLPHHHNTNELIPLLAQPSMADGSVITRFVSLDEGPVGGGQLHVPEIQSNHELANAPKDCFGIPMLPSVTMLDGSDPLSGTEAFDEASYGVWSTIMENADRAVLGSNLLESNAKMSGDINENYMSTSDENTAPIYAMNRPSMQKERRDRLEEFAAAFLDVSVFDFAEVWVPIGEQAGYLGQVTSVMSTDSKRNQSLLDFEKASEKILIKFWSGAVGRAFSSGNPVWSANKNVFTDAGRSSLFSQVKIETALAVPVFSGKSSNPSFVFSCYSFVRSGSVPFVLKFVQQALRLLWDGLDKVQPHKSVGEDLWRDVAPADLGEMAADVEMQQHFMKKRPRSATIEAAPDDIKPEDAALASGFKSMGTPSGVQPVLSIYTGTSTGLDEYTDEDFEPNAVVPIRYQPTQDVHSHLQQAVQSIGGMKPMHHHIPTNNQGSKRAHLLIERLDTPLESSASSSWQQHQQGSTSPSGHISEPAPLPMPRPLPLPNASLRQPTTMSHQVNHTTIQPLQNQTSGFAQQVQNYQVQDYQMQTQQQPQHPPQSNAQHYQSQPYIQPQQQPTMGNNQMMYSSQPQNSQPSQPSYGLQYNQNQQQSQGQHGQQQQQQPQYHAQQDNNNYNYQLHQIATQHQQQQPQQQQQEYLSSNEPLSLPSDFNSMQTAYPGSNANGQSHMMQQPNFSHVPANKISATGMVFPSSAQMSQPIQIMNVPGNGVGNGPLSSNGNTQFCQVVNPADMVATAGFSSGKPCRIQGCEELAVARRPYCTHHSGNRMCEHAGCSKCAQGSTRFCIAHGGGRRCTFPGCDKGARDKHFCAAHGGGKRCKFDGCNKSAVGGSQLCTAHGGGKRCSVDGCEKSAQSSTKFCVKHGGGKKCAQDGCEKVARGRTQYCAAHGGGVRCKLAGCNRVAIGKVQLCRAHGGGTRARKGEGGDLTPPLFGGGDSVDDPISPQPMDHSASSMPGFSDMPSI